MVTATNQCDEVVQTEDAQSNPYVEPEPVVSYALFGLEPIA